MEEERSGWGVTVAKSDMKERVNKEREVAILIRSL